MLPLKYNKNTFVIWFFIILFAACRTVSILLPLHPLPSSFFDSFLNAIATGVNMLKKNKKKTMNSYRGFRRFSDIHRTVLTSSECERNLDLENNVPPFKGSAQVDLWRHRPIAKAADKAVKYWAAKARSHKLCMRVFSLHIFTILLVLLFSPSFFDSVFLQLDSEVDAPAVNMPGTHLRFFQQR